MLVREFTKDELDPLGFPYCPEVIEMTLDGEGRWDNYYTIVFNYDGKTYIALDYCEGKTEYQDYTYWEMNDTLKAYEAEEVEVIKKEWLAKS